MVEHEHASGHLHITWLSLESGRIHLVARCDRCNVLAERTVVENADEGVLNVIATEALAARGCAHADEVMQVGARRARGSGTRSRERAHARRRGRRERHARPRHEC